jgi:hypothetical protein
MAIGAVMAAPTCQLQLTRSVALAFPSSRVLRSNEREILQLFLRCSATAEFARYPDYDG